MGFKLHSWEDEVREDMVHERAQLATRLVEVIAEALAYLAAGNVDRARAVLEAARPPLQPQGEPV